jgi:hypothetical protein
LTKTTVVNVPLLIKKSILVNTQMPFLGHKQ